MFPVTFNIITAGDADNRVQEVVDSIYHMHVRPGAYQINIVGGQTSSVVDPTSLAGYSGNLFHFPFDENERPGWITRKKNIATEHSPYEVCVYLHDYHVFDPNWYLNLVQFGLDWDVQMHQIIMQNGYRMFDWLAYDLPGHPRYCPIPYHRHDLVKHQYISGGYWVAKRSLMVAERQNESLGHHQAEDLDWSFRIRDKYRIRMNPSCIVRHNKPHRENELQKHRMQTLNDRFL